MSKHHILVHYPGDSFAAVDKLLHLLYIRDKRDINEYFDHLHDLAGLNENVMDWADTNRDAIEEFTAQLQREDVQMVHDFSLGITLN